METTVRNLQTVDNLATVADYATVGYCIVTTAVVDYAYIVRPPYGKDASAARLGRLCLRCSKMERFVLS